MLVSLSKENDALRIDPQFKLKPGLSYEVAIAEQTFIITMGDTQAPTPRLTSFAPSHSVLPSNTLRLYLHFSQPMARGQLRQNVNLQTALGEPVDAPFLSLDTELWNPTQTRATLLLDPGRIKQGVGPNTTGGAPLEVGRTYRLSISSQMQSAAGVPLSSEAAVSFRVGPPERRKLEPRNWEIERPHVGSFAPLSIAFDRIMDRGTVLRLVTLLGPDGAHIGGQRTTDGGGWSLVPNQPWRPGRYSLMIHPALEDIAGNTIDAPFDAKPGTIGQKSAPVVLTLDIAGNK
ncbi:MAG: hypothetical protein MK098_09425 [Marinovum sp.]|nr:hypothetical protein [Marinovum sp.]